MAICFDFRWTNVVQLSNQNPYLYQFGCHHPLITQLNLNVECTQVPKVKFFLQILQPKLGNSTTKLVQQFCNTITVNMKDWTSRLSKWWWWFEIFFGLHEWPLLKKKKVGYFKRLGPFKRCYNLQLVNIFCDHFLCRALLLHVRAH